MSTPHSFWRKTKMLKSSNLARWIEENAIQADLIKLPVHTSTVEDAAQAVGTSPSQIVKTLLFLVNGEPVVAIACGTSHINRRTIAAYFGVGRKRVKLADAEDVLEVTGYPVGAVPPFGLRQQVQTLIDPRVLEHTEVHAGGGAIDTLVRISPTEIVRVTRAVVLDLLGTSQENNPSDHRGRNSPFVPR
jgi:Cys-tRNA(Pro) deacylase